MAGSKENRGKAHQRTCGRHYPASGCGYTAAYAQRRARVGEILSLEWADIDLEQGTARLPDSKTGFNVLQLATPALAVLENLPRFGKWVFPAESKSGHMVNIKDAWGDVLKQTELTGWRIHDLRHCFASMMVKSGASLPIAGKILGHSNV